MEHSFNVCLENNLNYLTYKVTMKVETYLFNCEIAWSENLLYLAVASLRRCLDGRSKTVQNAFKCKFFHIGPSDFPQFLLLLRFNGDEFLFIYSTFTKIYSIYSVFLSSVSLAQRRFVVYRLYICFSFFHLFLYRCKPSNWWNCV